MWYLQFSDHDAMHTVRLLLVVLSAHVLIACSPPLTMIQRNFPPCHLLHARPVSACPSRTQPTNVPWWSRHPSGKVRSRAPYHPPTNQKHFWSTGCIISEAKIVVIASATHLVGQVLAYEPKVLLHKSCSYYTKGRKVR